MFWIQRKAAGGIPVDPICPIITQGSAVVTSNVSPVPIEVVDTPFHEAYMPLRPTPTDGVVANVPANIGNFGIVLSQAHEQAAPAVV